MGREESGNKNQNNCNSKKNNGKKHLNNFYNNVNKIKTHLINKNYVNIKKND